MSSGYKYTTKEEYLQIHRQQALKNYYEHRNEKLESKREYAKQYYRKNKQKILTQKNQELKKGTLSQPNIITPNFILEIVQ